MVQENRSWLPPPPLNFPQVNPQVYPITPPPLNFPQVKPQVWKQNFRFFKQTKVQQLYHDDCHPSLSEMKYFEMKWRKFDIFWPSFPQVLNIFLKFYVCRPPSHPIFLRFFHKFSIFSGLNPLPPLFLGPQKIRTWGKNRRSLNLMEFAVAILVGCLQRLVSVSFLFSEKVQQFFVCFWIQ